MDTFKELILNVISVALICGIVLQISGPCKTQKGIKLLLNVMMLAAICYPLKNMELKNRSMEELFWQEGNVYAERGVELGREARNTFIINACKSYVIEKGKALGLTIDAEITVDDHQIPTSACIYGNVSPYLQRELSEILEQELGITKENQMWTG